MIVFISKFLLFTVIFSNSSLKLTLFEISYFCFKHRERTQAYENILNQ